MTQSRTRRRTLATWLVWLVGGFLLAGIVLLAPVLPTPAFPRFAVPAGADSVRLQVGAHYRAGAIRRLLLGSRYRELWAEPISVAVLRFDRFEGGLRPVREGGGVQTRTLHLTSALDKRYIFRSVDKENSRLLRHQLGRSLLAWLLNDQTSSSHPVSALIAAPLQAAAGLPAPQPRLVVIPEDPALGAFGPRFAGLLGTLLENPAEYQPARPEVAEEVRNTVELLPLLDSTATQQVDARGFLTARLLDLFLNDWDRHEGQWRWVPETESGGTLWRPIPVDRDQAFSWYDGWLLALARLRTSKLARFGSEYPGLAGLTRNSAMLDRRLLTGLGRATWDSIAGWLEGRLTDSVIAAAVARQPPEYQRLSAPGLTAALERRRDGIRAIAARFYERLAHDPEVHVAGYGTVARVEQLPDGGVDLAVTGPGESGTPVTWLSRRFDPRETTRLTLKLHGAGPRVNLVGGGRGPIQVRVVDDSGRTLPVAALAR